MRAVGGRRMDEHLAKAVALSSLEQALRHATVALAAVAGEPCHAATRRSQIERTVRIATKRQFAAEERALARRLDPQRAALETKAKGFRQYQDAFTARRVLGGWHACAKGEHGQRRQHAATQIQFTWRRGYASRREKRLAALRKPPTPYEQLRDLLVRHPQLRSSMYAATATASSKPWKPHDEEQPKRQVARADLRRLERWLLDDSATREQLLELLGDHELTRVALLREIAKCGDDTAMSGRSPLKEARTAELEAEQSPGAQIRSRVRVRTVCIRADAAAMAQQTTASSSRTETRTAWESAHRSSDSATMDDEQQQQQQDSPDGSGWQAASPSLAGMSAAVHWAHTRRGRTVEVGSQASSDEILGETAGNLSPLQRSRPAARRQRGGRRAHLRTRSLSRSLQQSKLAGEEIYKSPETVIQQLKMDGVVSRDRSFAFE